MTDIKFNGELTCAISVRNLTESLAWYQQMLGCELVYRMDDLGWAEVRTPVSSVQIGMSETQEVNGAGGATLVFGVENIEAARKELERQGVRFDGATRVISGMVALATFYDPDGNVLMLYQGLNNPG